MAEISQKHNFLTWMEHSKFRKRNESLLENIILVLLINWLS